MSPRRLAVAATVAALSAGSIALAGGAEAAPPFSVSVEHCSGGIAITSYRTLLAATHAEQRAVTRQLTHPGVLRTIQLFRGARTIKVSTRHC